MTCKRRRVVTPRGESEMAIRRAIFHIDALSSLAKTLSGRTQSEAADPFRDWARVRLEEISGRNTKELNFSIQPPLSHCVNWDDRDRALYLEVSGLRRERIRDRKLEAPFKHRNALGMTL